MNKTLHQKLTSGTFYAHTAHSNHRLDSAIFTGMLTEVKILEQAAKDLLQPRPEAISRLLQLSRNMNSGN